MLNREHGFTLMEILVVLLVMGMGLGLASAMVRPSDQDILRVEADRLSGLLDLAMEESQFSGKSIAWTAEKTTYRFWRLSTDNEWREIRHTEWARARTLPRGMTISSLSIENNTHTQGPMRLEFFPGSSSLSFSVALALGKAQLSVIASPVGELRVGEGSGLALQ